MALDHSCPIGHRSFVLNKITAFCIGNQTAALCIGNQTAALCIGNQTAALRIGNQTAALCIGNQTAALFASWVIRYVPCVSRKNLRTT